ncbi:hypothetical protein BO221_13795 [Archangium sp. Cb G35]|uniref:hypothetical protein n=1 Tax=Archangium sp. Cb G35 TaxID=1920190 RepID=UPI0009373BF6|nr:hypothetical protein [Archangium sp. Cb G35]OJT24247.1 hypothetical protein BO221_13795 [Archangium sp. Cb G35]
MAEPRSAVRALALLFSVAIAGGLIGFAWERFAYVQPVDPIEDVTTDDMLSAPAPEPGRPSRSPWEEGILQRALSHFPPYPRGTRPEVLAADYLGEKSPIAVAWFTTQDTPDQVLSHYSGTLVDAGLPALGHRYNENAGYVGYWSPASKEVHLVSALAQGGETTVFVSSGQMQPLLEGGPQLPQWIPMHPEAEDTSALNFQLEGATQHTVSARVPESTVPEVEAFFREDFQKRGWSVTELHAPDEVGTELEVRRGAMFGLVMLRRQLPSSEVMVHMSLTERLTAPREGNTEETP